MYFCTSRPVDKRLLISWHCEVLESGGVTCPQRGHNPREIIIRVFLFSTTSDYRIVEVTSKTSKNPREPKFWIFAQNVIASKRLAAFMHRVNLGFAA